MPDITIVTEDELKQCVTLDKTVVDVIDRAFAKLAGGEVIMPAILSMAIKEHHGEVDVKTAYIPGLDGFAIKISPGFFNNPRLGLPSLNGLVVVFDSKTGIVKTVLLDNGLLTDIRTAAAGAVAARYLAPENIQTAGVIGAGTQAQLQIMALRLEHNFERVLVWARDAGKAQQYAEKMAAEIDCPVDVAQSARQCVAESQCVITTTPAEQALIHADWLHENLHITAMGSDAPNKMELDPHIFNRADRFIVDRKSQSIAQGELRPVLQAGLVDQSVSVDELGEICAGLKPARESDTQITVCDLTGTGLQDTAIADYASKQIIDHNLGTLIRN